MKRSSLFVLLLAAMQTLWVADAGAGTSSSSMNVTASIPNNCTIVTGTLGFGSYDPIVVNATAPKNASLAFALKCNLGTGATIDLDQGANPLGASTPTAPLRQMAAGADRLGYFLYADAGLTTAWGAGATSLTYTGTGFVDNSVVCYGSVPAGQSKPAGSYSDTVQATVNF